VKAHENGPWAERILADIYQWILNDDNFLRHECCECLLQVFTTTPKLGKVILFDRCTIYQSSRNRNVHM
jgi:hypothetical protein